MDDPNGLQQPGLPDPPSPRDPLPLPLGPARAPGADRAGVIAAVVASVLFLLAIGVGVVLLVLESSNAPRPVSPTADASGQKATGPANSTDAAVPPVSNDGSVPPVPQRVALAVAAQYPGWKVESLFWGTPEGESGGDLTALLSTKAVPGFKRLAVVSALTGADGSVSVSAVDDSIFDTSQLGYMPAQALGFERVWAKDYRDLACGTVQTDLTRDLASPLEAYQADGYMDVGPLSTFKAGTLSFRYNPIDQVWDTSTGKTLPPAITAPAARKVAERALPAFRFVSTVTNPAIVDQDLGDVFVLMRHPAYPGLLVAVDPLEGTPKAQGYFMDDHSTAREFFSNMDARAGALAREWTKRFPGTVVLGVEDFSDSGRTFDDVSVTYYPTVAAVATADPIIDDDWVEMVYDRQQNGWRLVPR